LTKLGCQDNQRQHFGRVLYLRSDTIMGGQISKSTTGRGVTAGRIKDQEGKRNFSQGSSFSVNGESIGREGLPFHVREAKSRKLRMKKEGPVVPSVVNSTEREKKRTQTRKLLENMMAEYVQEIKKEKYPKVTVKKGGQRRPSLCRGHVEKKAV